jgi:alkylation response protein AidB-like acyl-CoA dehydrogenase
LYARAAANDAHNRDQSCLGQETDPAERARGISLMLVETKDCAGFRVGRLLNKIGRKAQDTVEYPTAEDVVFLIHRR